MLDDFGDVRCFNADERPIDFQWPADIRYDLYTSIVVGDLANSKGKRGTVSAPSVTKRPFGGEAHSLSEAFVETYFDHSHSRLLWVQNMWQNKLVRRYSDGGVSFGGYGPYTASTVAADNCPGDVQGRCMNFLRA